MTNQKRAEILQLFFLKSHKSVQVENVDEHHFLDYFLNLLQSVKPLLDNQLKLQQTLKNQYDSTLPYMYM